jgi:tryptophan-rich sensory protein
VDGFVTSSAQRRYQLSGANLVRLIAFIVLVLGIGMAIGYLNMPGEWYAALSKPSFNPPDWIFAPVWSVLFVMIGGAGWRTWERKSDGAGMKLWIAQMVLNFSWSPVFFTLHSIGAALVIIVALLAAILGFIARRWPADRLSALFFMPYALWVSFATVLNTALFLLN